MTAVRYLVNSGLSLQEIQAMERDILQVWQDGKPRPLADCLPAVKDTPNDITLRVILQLVGSRKLVKTADPHPFGRPCFVLNWRKE